jgi:hypothetical protein
MGTFSGNWRYSTHYDGWPTVRCGHCLFPNVLQQIVVNNVSFLHFSSPTAFLLGSHLAINLPLDHCKEALYCPGCKVDLFLFTNHCFPILAALSRFGDFSLGALACRLGWLDERNDEASSCQLLLCHCNSHKALQHARCTSLFEQSCSRYESSRNRLNLNSWTKNMPVLFHGMISTPVALYGKSRMIASISNLQPAHKAKANPSNEVPTPHPLNFDDGSNLVSHEVRTQINKVHSCNLSAEQRLH